MLRGVGRGSSLYIADVEAADWMVMYGHTHAAGNRIEWPDGGCYFGQLQILIDVWSVISEQVRIYKEERQR